MEEERKDEKQVTVKGAVITAALISCTAFLIYRAGVKRGYKDALKFVESSWNMALDSLDITNF